MIEKVFDIVKDNLKNPKFYFIILIGMVMILLLFPYIDANFFYYNRVEKRIAILNDVAGIEKEKLLDNDILKAEYESILAEISKQKDGSLGSVFITNNTEKISKMKFITGAILSWFIAILCLFIKMEKIWQKLVGLLIFLMLGVILGGIASVLPTVIKPMCNYLLVPIVQLILLGILVTSGNSK